MSSNFQEKEHQPFLKYSDDATIAESASETGQRYHTPQSQYSRFMSYAVVFAFTSAVWATIFVLITPSPTSNYSTPSDPADPNSRHNITSNSILINCGNSTTEARAAGCKYDVLLNHWVPPPCWDDEFLEEYQDDGSWTAFTDKEMTQPITTIDEMSEREFYWTSVRDHINHCAVLWKKQFFAIFEERKAIDSIIASPGHTDHCAQYLMDVTLRNVTSATKVEIGFAGCWVRQ